MNRSARWMVVMAAIPLLLAIGASTAGAIGVYNSEPTHSSEQGSRQAFSDLNWKPQGSGGGAVTSRQPFSDPNWKPAPTVGTAPEGQPAPVGGGTGVPTLALIAGLGALLAGIGAYAGTLRFRRLRIASGG